MSDEKKDRCRFQMSMKLEKTDVRPVRSSKGCGVSSEVMIGVRKCLRCDQRKLVRNWGRTHRIYQLKSVDIGSFRLVKLLDDFPSFPLVSIRLEAPPVISSLAVYGQRATSSSSVAHHSRHGRGYRSGSVFWKGIERGYADNGLAVKQRGCCGQ